MNISINPDLTGVQEPSRLTQAWEVAMAYAVEAPIKPAQVPSDVPAVATVSGSLPAGARSAQDGLAIVQTADNTFGNVASLLRRMDLIAAMCGGGTALSPAAQAALQNKFEDLQVEVARIQSAAQWKGMDVLAGHDLVFKEGRAAEHNVTIDGATTLTPVDVSKASVADATPIQDAIDSVDSKRADLATAKDRLIDGLRGFSTADQSSAPLYAVDLPEERDGLSLLL